MTDDMREGKVNPRDPKTWPPDWWRAGHIAAQLSHDFSKGIIALGVAYTVNGEPRYEVFSGFLLLLGDVLFWLTARHVIEGIEELRDHEAVRIEGASWLGWDENPDRNSIPITLEHLPVRRDENRDFALVLIRPAFANPILAGPDIEPFTPVLWHNHEAARPEGYYVVGFPEIGCYSRLAAENGPRQDWQARAHLVCFPVERIGREANGEPVEFWEDREAFYGRAVSFSDGTPNDHISSIKGMSGGPIISVERDPDGRLRKRLFGIQSSWLPQRRIIRAVSISSAVAAMERWFDELAQQTNRKAVPPPNSPV